MGKKILFWVNEVYRKTVINFGIGGMYGHRLLDNSRFFIVLLVLTVVLNSTQAVVLCEGCNGHIAVELAGHHHCHNTEDCQRDSSRGMDDCNASCRACVDIPLSSGILVNSSIQNAPTKTTTFAGTIPSSPEMIDPGCETAIVAQTCPAFTRFYIPLSSIILIV